ncbi:undecaprenyl-phosphate glucose phosphotransferase [Hydrogenophaga atypica]|uniref:Undecaprenyl-phosphate glucose phosphotransferase n=1 Tax=Hydrogenophaga atypica TaxID=249409 RepID=A0ABW2QK16_9BURK
MLHLNGQRSVLQRRSNISNALQALLDGTAVLGIAYWLIDRHLGFVSAPYTFMVVLLLGMLGLLYDQLALYRSNANFTTKALKIFQAWTLAFAMLLALGFLTKQTETFSRLLVGQLYVLGFFAQLLLHLLLRVLQRQFLKHAVEPENVLVVGTGSLASYLHQKITQNPWLSERVVGCVGLPGHQPNAAADGRHLPPLLGTLDDLMALLDQHQIRTVYFAIPLDASSVIESLYFRLLDRHIAVHWVPDIFSLRLVNHSVREIAGVPVLTLSETPLTGTRRLIKSLEDVVLSALILLVILPLLLVIAVAIRLDSPGPVFFRQPRMGWNGKTFRIWKFRSMFVHRTESNTVQQATKNDPRITRVGAFLRKTSLDELPQLFNVLTGDMSLVGPRPHAVQHDLEYSQRIEQYFARHNIKPGITGLAQVRGHRGETRDLDQMIQRVESDIEYINNWSLWLDLFILARTTMAFSGKNAY